MVEIEMLNAEFKDPASTFSESIKNSFKWLQTNMFLQIYFCYDLVT